MNQNQHYYGADMLKRFPTQNLYKKHFETDFGWYDQKIHHSFEKCQEEALE
jgi:hypothetical protein